jgi:hypothetical protein
MENKIWKQEYNSLENENEKHKNLFATNQKQIQEKALLLAQLNNVNVSLQSQNTQS